MDDLLGPETLPDVQIAFQPIVDVKRQSVYAYEALVRGGHGESASDVFAAVPCAHRPLFDHRLMLLAVFTAAKLKLRTRLAVNVSPDAFVHPATVHSLRCASTRTGIPAEHIILELTESEPLDLQRAAEALRAYRTTGFITAIDDFGAGYAGLNLLASFQPHLLKIDMQLVQGIAHDAVRRAIVESIVMMAARVRCEVVAEGVETAADARQLFNSGIRLQQGFLYARPGVEALPVPDFTWMPVPMTQLRAG